MHRDSKLSNKYEHFLYVSPDTNQKGKLTYDVIRTFDGLNQFVIHSFRKTIKRLLSDGQFSSLITN